MIQPTIQQIAERVGFAGRTLSRSSLYRCLKTLGIKPIGARQKPQRYPAEAPDLIISHLGLAQPPQYTEADYLLSLEEIKRRAKRGKGFVPLTKREARKVEAVAHKGALAALKGGSHAKY